MRIHTIHRETGAARVWQLPMAFFTHYDGNTFDTEGACQWLFLLVMWLALGPLDLGLKYVAGPLGLKYVPVGMFLARQRLLELELCRPKLFRVGGPLDRYLIILLTSSLPTSLAGPNLL